MKDEVVVAFILGYFFGRISQRYGGIEPTAKKVIIFVIDAYDILFGNMYDIRRKRKQILAPIASALQHSDEMRFKEIFKEVLQEINNLNVNTEDISSE